MKSRGLSTPLKALVLALVIVTASVAIVLMERGAVSRPQGITQITKPWLDQQLVAWKPSKNGSLIFGAFFQQASYGNLEYAYNDMAVQQADLRMLLATGVSCIRIDIGYAPWLQGNQTAINEMSALVSDIREAGKCLVIADAASETYRNGHQIPWTQFQQAWIQRVRTLASLYHPDYYIVVKEPGWYVALVSDSRSNPQFLNATVWLNLTDALASAVLSVSPATKVGVSVAASSIAGANSRFYDAYLAGVSQSKYVSFVGFDIYDVTGFLSTQGYLDRYGVGNKAIWIAEAWSGDGPTVFNASRAQLDSEWLLALYYFAQTIHAEAVMPFYTNLFASYSLEGNLANSSETVSLFQQRTPAFYEFRGIISSANATS